MKIGVPKEIKNHEYRVGLTPASVREFVAHGHSVMVQAGAGAAIGLDDAQYRAAGATLADSAHEVFATGQNEEANLMADLSNLGSSPLFADGGTIFIEGLLPQANEVISLIYTNAAGAEVRGVRSRRSAVREPAPIPRKRGWGRRSCRACARD